MTIKFNASINYLELLQLAEFIQFGTTDLSYSFANHRWKQADSIWFKANKQREIRLRAVMTDEFSSRHQAMFDSPPTHVLTRKTSQNTREKMFITLSNAKHMWECQDDVLAALWDHSIKCYKKCIDLDLEAFIAAQAEIETPLPEEVQ